MQCTAPLLIRADGKRTSFSTSVDPSTASPKNPSTTTTNAPSNDHLIPTKKIIKDLSHDIVEYICSSNTKEAPSDNAITLRRVTKEILEKHSIVFNGMLKKLNFKALESSKEVCDCLGRVFEEMFIDNNINWGRLVMVYAFAALTAKHCIDVNKRQLMENIPEYLNQYVSESFAAWIYKNGGWDAFNNYFPEEKSMETKIWQGLLYTFLGLGALATINWK